MQAKETIFSLLLKYIPFLTLFELDINSLLQKGPIFLQMEPTKRISAKAAMKHEYFTDLPPKIHELPDGMKNTSSFNSLIDCMYGIVLHFQHCFQFPATSAPIHAFLECIFPVFHNFLSKPLATLAFKICRMKGQH